MFTCAGWLEIGTKDDLPSVDIDAPLRELLAGPHAPRGWSRADLNHSRFLHLWEAHNHDSGGQRATERLQFVSDVCAAYDDSSGVVHFLNDELPPEEAVQAVYVERGQVRLIRVEGFDPWGSTQ